MTLTSHSWIHQLLVTAETKLQGTSQGMLEALNSGLARGVSLLIKQNKVENKTPKQQLQTQEETSLLSSGAPWHRMLRISKNVLGFKEARGKFIEEEAT